MIKLRWLYITEEYFIQPSYINLNYELHATLHQRVLFLSSVQFLSETRDDRLKLDYVYAITTQKLLWKMPFLENSLLNGENFKLKPRFATYFANKCLNSAAVRRKIFLPFGTLDELNEFHFPASVNKIFVLE